MGQQCVELRYKEVSTLLASDTEAYGYFGTSVTVAGNRLVIGVPGKDTVGVDAGKVYAYDWNGTAYVEVLQLTASDAEDYDLFGSSVALSSDGNRLVVGATGEDTAAPYAGKVYIYDWSGVAYIEVTAITASDAEDYDWFGSSVALASDGNRLVVGATGEDTAGMKAGKVYIYEWNGGAYVEVAQLTASDAVVHDQFGRSVALSGNRLVVGAHYEDTAGVNAGKVYVYEWNGVAYIEVAQLTASDASAWDVFGTSVALSGNRLVVGAQYQDTAGMKAGKVYVYDWNSDTCACDEVAQLTASDTHGYDYFGSSVALSGNRLVLGACGVRVSSLAEAGKVYVYDRNGTEEQ